MADIRQSTTIKDDFNRPDEFPIALPWALPNTDAGAVPCQIENLFLTGSAFPSTPSVAYWTPESWNGNGAEVWATAVGDAPSTESWRIGLMTDVGLGSGAIDGYLCLPANPFGPDVWVIRKYTNGGFSTIASVDHVLPSPPPTHIVLMRCNGTSVEVWMSPAGDPDGIWELVVSAVDNTYRSNLFAVLGTTGTNPGWDDFGGGPVNTFRPQFYRRHHHTSR